MRFGDFLQVGRPPPSQLDSSKLSSGKLIIFSLAWPSWTDMGWSSGVIDSSLGYWFPWSRLSCINFRLAKCHLVQAHMLFWLTEKRSELIPAKEVIGLIRHSSFILKVCCERNMDLAHHCLHSPGRFSALPGEIKHCTCVYMQRSSSTTMKSSSHEIKQYSCAYTVYNVVSRLIT